MGLLQGAQYLNDRNCFANNTNSAACIQPTMMSEYPRVDGHLSNECYLRSLDLCYQRFADKYFAKTGQSS